MRRLFLPVRSDIDVPSTSAAFGTDNLRGEGWHVYIAGVFRHVDEPLMAARIVEARCDQPLHAEMAHVAERHSAARAAVWLWP